MIELPGVALITGAGSGIGQATALAFAQAGCSRISLIDLNAKGLEETRKQVLQLNPKIKVILEIGSITNNDFVERAVENLVKEFGRLDYAVNCAGTIGPWATSTDCALEDHDRVMDVNYRGTFLCSRAEIRAMLKNEPSGPEDIPGQRGAIVHISSGLGLVGRQGAPAYCASKGAVIQLAKADAMDYSTSGIRINCVLPGLTDTPLATNNNDPATLKALQPLVDVSPMKRWGRPREVADAAVYLCSSRASFIQGHGLAVDGGYLIQ